MSLDSIRTAFDPDTLAQICAMPESAFRSAFGLTRVKVPQSAPANYYLHRDNGAHVLAVAHLDTVAPHDTRGAQFVETQAGTVVHSRALDDRLGAYVILDLLPRLGITCDWLLTTGEECGQSTASYYESDKAYDWVIEFDRGGTDVVMYQYDDSEVRELVRASGARVGEGSFSDIAYLEHLGVKAFNWGIGYRDYHGPRAHAYLDDTYTMVGQYLEFHATNAGTAMPHYPMRRDWWDMGRDDWPCLNCRGTNADADGYCRDCGYCIDCGESADDCLCRTSDKHGASYA